MTSKPPLIERLVYTVLIILMLGLLWLLSFLPPIALKAKVIYQGF